MTQLFVEQPLALPGSANNIPNKVSCYRERMNFDYKMVQTSGLKNTNKVWQCIKMCDFDPFLEFTSPKQSVYQLVCPFLTQTIKWEQNLNLDIKHQSDPEIYDERNMTPNGGGYCYISQLSTFCNSKKILYKF